MRRPLMAHSENLRFRGQSGHGAKVSQYPLKTLPCILDCCAYCELPGDEGGGGSGVTGLAGVTGALGAARTAGAGVFWVAIDVGNGRPCG